MRKKFNLIKNILLSNFKRLTSPYKVTFALTYRCNLKCEICKIWGNPVREELGVKEIEKVFKVLGNLSWLDLTGGEITLREDLIDVTRVIVRNAKNLLIFHISTNGQLPEKLFFLVQEVLRRNLVPVVNVSLDAPPEINDILKGKNGAYVNSINAFNLLSSLKKGHYYISCTLSDYNIDYLDTFIAQLRNDLESFSFSNLHFNIFHNSSHYYKNDFLVATAKLKNKKVLDKLGLCREGNIIKNFLEYKYLRGLYKYLDGEKFLIRCQALKSACFINPYGEVYPCGIYSNVIGNLKNYDYNLNLLWRDVNALRTIKDIEERRCSGCWSPCEVYPAILGNLLKGNL